MDDHQTSIRMFEEIFARLAHPFADAHERSGRGGRSYKYLDQYQVMNRLDDVVGPANWSCEHSETPNAVRCKITITMPDGSQVTRDGASQFDSRKPGDREDRLGSDVAKTAYADSFKKAAEAFGVGRYLKGRLPSYYRRAAARRERTEEVAPVADPEPDAGRTQALTSEPPTDDEFPARPPREVRPGPLLFHMLSNGIYAKEKYVHIASKYGAEQGFPGRIVDWSQEQVGEFCAANGLHLPVPRGRNSPQRVPQTVGAPDSNRTDFDEFAGA